MTRLLDVWNAAARKSSPEPRANEIWPLISHHTFGDRTLFTQQAERTILPRVLTLLLAHDGVVAADPLADIQRLVSMQQKEQALHSLQNVVAALAASESLVGNGVLRFTHHRPALADEARRAILDVFGLDPSLKVFTNFLEAAVTVESSPRLFESEYRPQVEELFRLVGLKSPTIPSLDESVTSVRELAASVVEVSWQMAVCSQDPSCDIALSGDTELELAGLVLDAGFDELAKGNWSKALGKTRHVKRLRLGNLPNLAPDDLTVEDSLAIRRDDLFEEFRARLRVQLDVLDDGLRTGQDDHVARAIFEEGMTEAANSLARGVRRSTLGSRLRDASIPAAVGAVNAVVLSPIGRVASAGGGAMAALSTVFWQWLMARRTPSGAKVARRYFSVLGGSVTEYQRS